MQRGIQVLIITILLIVLVSLFVPPVFIISPIKNTTSRIFIPAERAITGIFRGLIDFGKTVGDIRHLAKENVALKEEIERLNAENSQLLEVKNENRILKEQLQFVSVQKDYSLVAAEVVGRDPNNFLQYISLDKGQKDGIAPGQSVISESHLVGKVSEVTSNSAQVFLITNPQSIVNAMVQRSRATGIVKGKLGYGILLESVPQDASLEVGDRIISSGLGGDFPKGLLIGIVEEVRSIQSEIFQSADLRPEVNFNRLEVVFVITKF